MDEWLQPSKVQTVAPQLRSNLRWCEHAGRYRSWWILSDPVSNRNFRCDHFDARLLQLLDGKRTFYEVRQELSREYPSIEASTQRLASIMDFAKSNQLLFDSRANSDAQSLTTSTNKKVSRFGEFLTELRKLLLLLVYQRVSLGNPNQLACGFAKRSDWLFSAQAVTAWIAVVIVSMVAALLASHQLKENEWSRAFSFASIAQPSLWVGAIVVFVATRCLHELAHATVCCREGASCNDFGLMRILCIAFPYVDVTEAWRVPYRSSRTLVYAAGIYVDLIIAAFATWVWLATWPGYVHSLALITMVMCAVVSLLFNANPLMKYDGYYLLCEALEIADLQVAARRAWLDFWQRLLGVRTADRPKSQHHWNRSLQWLLQLYYPIAAGYRFSISIALLVGIFLTFHTWKLTELGWMLSSMMVMLGLGITVNRRITNLHKRESKPHHHAGRRKTTAWPRVLRSLVWCIALLGFFAAMLVPIPERVYAKGKVTSANRVALYSTVPSTALANIDRSSNTEIQLDRTQADEELLRLQQSIDELDARRQLIQKAAFFDAGLLTQLPQLETVRQLREQRLSRLKEQFKAYTIQVQSNECFVAVPLSDLEYVPSELGAGQPFKSKLTKFPTVMSDLQHGALVQQGTLLGYRCPLDREASIEVTLPQESRSDIFIGQRANVRTTQLPFQLQTATVAAISQLIKADPKTVEPEGQATASFYRVLLRLEQAEDYARFVENGNAEVVFKARGKSVFARSQEYFAKLMR